MADYDFWALHSPVGANASFALGLKGAGGGFTLENDRVGEQDVFIGIRQGQTITCFPFFKDAVSRLSESFVQTAADVHEMRVSCFEDSEIKREYLYGADCFEAGPIRYEIACPVREIPDPATGAGELLKDVLAPVLLSRLIVDNTEGDGELEAFFGVSPMMGKQFLSQKTGGRYRGILSRSGYGFASVSDDGAEITEIADFDLLTHYERKKETRLTVAGMGALFLKVPAGKKCVVDIALGWFRPGKVTYGALECEYYYTRFFGSLEDVLFYGLSKRDEWWRLAEESSKMLMDCGIGREKEFLTIHSVRAYYASTMLFSCGGRPLWVVNEGSFMMMNTLDLSVDHCFFELKYHPWAVRNQLDLFAECYSYYDQCGVSFTHDCGTHHTFTPFGTSSYEISGIDDCFSYMTQEQLCNWILMAGMYYWHTKDKSWLEKRRGLIRSCLESMINRTGGDANGIMKIDSAKCEGGAEITTYDSLDRSLGQARDNVYIVMKCFASYLSLELLLRDMKCAGEAARAHEMASKCASGVAGWYDEKLGFVPAILDGQDTSAIIPIIEPLIYLYYTGQEALIQDDGEFAFLRTALKEHTTHILKKGVCLFEDGGFKLSANNDNSWMSKIFICSVTASLILGIPVPKESDEAHVSWWKEGCKDNPGIDQIIKGRTAESGFHYPRGVTSVLWTEFENR